MNYNALYNSAGKISADSDFFSNFKNAFSPENGIIDGFKSVLGEQIIHVRKAPRTPIYSLAISAPLQQGAAWSERVLKRHPTYEYNPKASASDALSYYDSEGVEEVFFSNVAGRKSVSTASDLTLRELVHTEGAAGQINDYIVDGMQKEVQEELEAQAGVRLVSSISHEITGADMSSEAAIRKLISHTAIDMMTDSTQYADINIDGERAESVVCLIDAKMAADLGNSEAYIFDSSKLNVDARVIPVYGGLPTPITTAQYSAGRGAQSGAYSGSAPAAIDKDKPDMIIMDAEYFKIRPFIGEWKLTMDRNGAGDFENIHCLYKTAMAHIPWKSAVRVYAASE